MALNNNDNNSSSIYYVAPPFEIGQLYNDTPSPLINRTTIFLDHSAYYGDVFLHLNYQYRQVHGHFSLAVCVFGIIANVLNIIVLSRYVFKINGPFLIGRDVQWLLLEACQKKI